MKRRDPSSQGALQEATGTGGNPDIGAHGEEETSNRQVAGQAGEHERRIQEGPRDGTKLGHEVYAVGGASRAAMRVARLRS